MRGAAFASLQKSAPESPFLSMNRGPVRYGFSAGAKAIRYNVNIAESKERTFFASQVPQ